MDLKDMESLLGLNPEFGSKVQRVLEELRAGKLPDFVDSSRRRQTLLADMQERLRGLRSAREESIRRFDTAIRTQEEAIARLEQEIGSTPGSGGRPEEPVEETSTPSSAPWRARRARGRSEE